MKSIVLFAFLSVITLSGYAQSAPDELRLLRKMSSNDLLYCAFQIHTGGCKYDTYALADELGRRGNAEFLSRRYIQADAEQREVIILAMAQIKKNPIAKEFMRKIAFSYARKDELDTEPRWYALQYLADECDPAALRRLNGDHNFRDSYPIGCMYWTETIATFGKCSYRPAVQHLIESTNSVACLNISEAAIKSLQQLFPGKCKNPRTLDNAHDCFLKAATEKVNPN